MKGQNRQSQRLAAQEKKAQKARKFESTHTTEDILDIIAAYNSLTPSEREGGLKAKYEDLPDKAKLKFLLGEIRALKAKEAKYLKLADALAGLEPQVSKMLRSESKYVYPVLKELRDRGFEQITYIMLKKAISYLIEQEKGDGFKYKFNTSMKQVKNYLAELGIESGPRVYVSVGIEGEKLNDFEWLDEGPIELFGGCANGEQRTHWISCITGVLHPETGIKD